ncbi:tRNA pseudouridine synthase [Nymphaea thermarum]|nr:tRNA pseudouridine synthase [Nymphaea thermarum]
MPQSRADSPSPEEQSKRPIDSPVDLSKPQKIARVDSGDQQSESLKPEARKMGFQRYLVAVEYIGTKFSGSQKQLNGRTVEGVLEDVGVHALSNTFHVDVERISKRKPGEVKNEGDIMLLDVRTIPANFHARFNAKERIYYYRILSGEDALSIFEKERAWHVPEKLDLLAMQAKSPVKTLDELRVCEVIPSSSFPSNTENGQKDEGLFGGRKRHRLYMITARARSFLYHQVRLLVGLLKSVGTGDLNIDDVERILNARTITETPPMAPACGLYLGNENGSARVGAWPYAMSMWLT